MFDLDPSDGVSWALVQEAVLLARTILEKLGPVAWLNANGGNGLRVVAPIAPRRDYDTVTAFSLGVAQHMATTISRPIVAKSSSARLAKNFTELSLLHRMTREP